MSSKEHAVIMARYNRWQNESLIAAADNLSMPERDRDRGAFFGSISKTFSHILWGDRIWMHRFAGTPLPDGGIAESVSHVGDWQIFTEERRSFDQTILDWSDSVAADWFDGNLTWHSGAAGRDVTKSKKLLVAHFFNHQTHHRGQIHAMLTAAGAKPEDTDIPFMPEAYAKGSL